MCIHLSHLRPFWIQWLKLPVTVMTCDDQNWLGHDALWLWSAQCDRCRTWWISLDILDHVTGIARNWKCRQIMTNPWRVGGKMMMCQFASRFDELRSILVQLLALAIDHLIVKVKPRRIKACLWILAHWPISLWDWTPFNSATENFQVQPKWEEQQMSLQSVNASLHKLHRIEPSMINCLQCATTGLDIMEYSDLPNRSRHSKSVEWWCQSKGQYSTKAGHIHILPNAVRVILTAENMQWLCSCRITPNRSK